MLNPPIEATVLLQKCTVQHKTAAIRLQKLEDGDWWRTWAFPIADQTAAREGFDRTPITGSMYPGEDFEGCPYCGTYGFVQCGNCRKLNCWREETSGTCEWCHQPIDNIVIASEFTVDGDQF